jgi:hypothetical protein
VLPPTPQAAGAELVVALTHMRLPNDQLLAQSVPEIDLVLGGHDHCYYTVEQPSGNWVVKSGSDFKDLSLLKVQLQEGARPRVVHCERQSITSDVPEDPQTAQVGQGQAPAALGAGRSVLCVHVAECLAGLNPRLASTWAGCPVHQPRVASRNARLCAPGGV